MKKMFRKDEKAVSPVIATILMVAITVVLAAVLYVMVSGLIASPHGGPRSMGVNVGRSSDATNWTISITSTPSGQASATTYLTIYTPGGSAASTCDAVALSSLSYTTNGAVFTGTGTDIKPGDKILVKTSMYPDGYTFEIHDANGILAAGDLKV